MPLTSEEDIADLLRSSARIAMVGASGRPDRPSFGVLAYLLAHGYDVMPINPGLSGQRIQAQPVIDSLSNITDPVDLVDIFRSSEAAGDAVDAAIAHGAKAVWMQIGVINHAAAERAEAAGLKVVMDRCPKVEMARLGITGPA